MAKRIRIGDVFEVRTSKGLAYFQYTHEHRDPPKMGALIRVLRAIYAERPDDFIDIISQPHKFQVFVPLQVSVNMKLVDYVENFPVPKSYLKFPIFRTGVINPSTKKVDDWWFWDGKKEWQVGKLSSEQKKIPIRGTITIPLLIKRIESGWTPETDPST